MKESKPANGVIEGLKKLLIIVFVLAFVVYLYYFSGIGCPIKFFTGVSCAGCGMSRAYFALLKGDVASAFYYHPLFPVPAIFVPVFYFRKKLGRVYYFICAIFIALFVGVYLYRIISGGQNIVVFEPQKGFFYRLILFFT